MSTSYQNAFVYTEGIHKKNPLAVFNVDESAINSLKGFPVDSAQNQLLSLLNTTDDGVRGQLLFDGDMKMNFGCVLGGVYNFAEHWYLRVLLGIYSYELKNFSITDKTQLKTVEDIRTKELLTNNIKTVARTIGKGLLLEDWTRTGLSDLTTYVVWENSFAQEGLLLKNIDVDIRVGLSLPTAKRSNPDLLVAESFGNDGASSFLFGASLCSQCTYFSFGFDIELTYIFGKMVEQRIKTSRDQTDLLLLQKNKVFKEFGMNQRFDIYIQAHDENKRICGTIGYHYFKHGDDNLTVKNGQFSSRTANHARSLDDFTAHHLMFNLACNPEEWLCYQDYFPQFNLYAKVPFNGKNVIVSSTIGFGVSINF
jgi:hypothetical protein